MRWVADATPRPHFTPGKDPVPIVLLYVENIDLIKGQMCLLTRTDYQNNDNFV
jgi:hypothetical protein